MGQQPQFSEREKQVIELLVQGRSNKKIALALGVSRRTVEFYLSNIYSKLGVTSRTEAALLLSKPHLRESTGGELREYTVPLLFGSDIGGDRKAGSEPYWAPLVKDGRCIRIGIPIGSSDPTRLTLTIPELVMEDPDVLMSDQLSRDYPGLSAKEAYQTYLAEHGKTYNGPWRFNVELTP